MQEGETSPILRYNMERRQLIEDYKRWLKLDENAVLSRMESLSIDCNMGLVISLDYSLFCNLVNLSIGNNSFASLSDLVLSEMFFLKHVTIGDNCFNGKMQGRRSAGRKGRMAPSDRERTGFEQSGFHGISQRRCLKNPEKPKENPKYKIQKKFINFFRLALDITGGKCYLYYMS